MQTFFGFGSSATISGLRSSSSAVLRAKRHQAGLGLAIFFTLAASFGSKVVAPAGQASRTAWTISTGQLYIMAKSRAVCPQGYKYSVPCMTRFEAPFGYAARPHQRPDENRYIHETEPRSAIKKDYHRTFQQSPNQRR